jgi:hypothetical protein
MKRLFLLILFVCLVSRLFAGSFIVNYYIKDVKNEELKAYVLSKKLLGYIIEQDKYEGLIFCEKISSNQDDIYGAALGLSISKDLNCRVIYSLIHDSDVLLIQYFKDGELLLNYNSWPGYFDGNEPKPRYGNIEVFCADFEVDKTLIKNILDNKNKHIFAEDILSEFAKTISAPEVIAYCSYNYMESILPYLKEKNISVTEVK